MTLEIGSQLAGYRIVGILGEGGMGIVYEAEHALLGRKAALKSLLRELSANEEYKARFIRESQAVASIDHPNIIPVYDAGETEGTAYIAMRYVPGGDLADLIEQRGALPPQEVLSILDQAGAALDAAHARGLVHRDVKPGNILIEETTGRIYLTDFGIVKEQGRSNLTRAGFFLGTIDYAAPEQIEGQDLTGAADRYAFGCVLFECLTGHRPYEHPSDLAVMRAHVLDAPPRVTALRPELPPALDQIVERALAKEPEKRFDSCRSLIEAARLAFAEAPGSSPGLTADAVAAAPASPAQAKGLTATNLPAQTAPLFGRERELEEIVSLLRDDSVRLITVTGFGGTGKTRLALEAAGAVEGDFDRVALVDLSAVEDVDLVPAAIVQALGAEVTAGSPAVDAIRNVVGASRVLLLLDFAHVLPVGPLVTELLESVPTLRLVVAGQAPLRVRGEHEYLVQPLQLPADVDSGDLDALAESPAVALFVDRARAVRPGFELTGENAEAVADICTRLDGIPLAIELAAARVKLLTPQALRGRLERRLDLLTGGAADLPARQRTLRGAIDWTFGLLEETDQAMLARLGVFVGGCSFEGAEAVAGSSFGLELGAVMDALASLVDKGLLRQAEGADGEPRFSMLGTIREYALDRLEERGEADRVRERHAERFLELAEMAEPELAGTNQAAWLAKLDEEVGNLQAAFAWALEAGRVELALRLTGALVRFGSIRGLMAEGRERLARALGADADVPPAVRAKGEFAAGYAALGLGELAEAETHFGLSLELAAGDPAAEAAARAQLAWIACTRATDGGDPALALATQSLEQARAVDDKHTASGALQSLAELALRRGETEEALTLMEEALALRRSLGDSRLVANSLLALARVRLGQGDAERAQALLEEGRAVAEGIGDGWSLSLALAGLGRLRLLEDAPAEACALFREALGLAATRRDKRAAAECLQGLGSALVLTGDAETGIRLLGAADTVLEAIGASPGAADGAVDERVHPLLRSRLGADYEAQLASGRSLTIDQALVLALPAVKPGTISFEPAAAPPK
ncbi:MAG TPA: protein kinase [Gaiellaceae bacterium]|jgi:non-specific serine/threonine protein kinase